jgi:hypothetical protein
LAAAAAGALGILALLTFPLHQLDDAGPQSDNNVGGPVRHAGAQEPWSRVLARPVEARSRPADASPARRDQPTTRSGEVNGDGGLEPAGQWQAVPVATQTPVAPSAPAPAPTPAAAAPTPAAAPAPSAPEATGAPEFGFER